MISSSHSGAAADATAVACTEEELNCLMDQGEAQSPERAPPPSWSGEPIADRRFVDDEGGAGGVVLQLLSERSHGHA